MTRLRLRAGSRADDGVGALLLGAVAGCVFEAAYGNRWQGYGSHARLYAEFEGEARGGGVVVRLQYAHEVYVAQHGVQPDYARALKVHLFLGVED